MSETDDVQQLVATVQLTPLAETVRELRATVERLLAERDYFKSTYEAAKVLMAEQHAERDAQVRDAFFAGRAAYVTPRGWRFKRQCAEENYYYAWDAYLAALQRVSQGEQP